MDLGEIVENGLYFLSARCAKGGIVLEREVEKGTCIVEADPSQLHQVVLAQDLDLVLHAGEVLIIEPGEEHYIIGDPAYPIINLWFHCGDEPHPAQRGD